MKNKEITLHPNTVQGKLLLKAKSLIEQNKADSITEALTLLRGLGLDVKLSDVGGAIVFSEGQTDHPNGKNPFVSAKVRIKIEHAELGYVFLDEIEKDLEVAYKKGWKGLLVFSTETVQGLIKHIKENC